MKHSHREQEKIVACVPVEEAKFLMPSFPKSIEYSIYEQVKCPGCQAMMWLGQRGKVEVESGRATMLCMPCVLARGYAYAITNTQTLHKA